jgi:hypothetical protein
MAKEARRWTSGCSTGALLFRQLCEGPTEKKDAGTHKKSIRCTKRTRNELVCDTRAERGKIEEMQVLQVLCLGGDERREKVSAEQERSVQFRMGGGRRANWIR